MKPPTRPDVAVVIPTVGRPSLAVLLDALAAQPEPPTRILLVDDRSDGGLGGDDAVIGSIPPSLVDRTTVLHSGGRGPAAARNRGWRATTAEWIVFLDDDVIPDADWSSGLADDLTPDQRDVVQAVIRVPLPDDRAPTDAERNVALLESAPWISADLAVRRAVLADIGGFDERFRRAYREDTDFAIRAESAGYRLTAGSRVTRHPVRPDPWWSCITRQRGNADDVLLSALHGPGRVPRGRRRRHAVVSAALAIALVAGTLRRRRAAALAALVWGAGTAEFISARLRPGPRTLRELATVTVTSFVIPPVAISHWLRGQWRWRHVAPAPPRLPRHRPAARSGPALRRSEDPPSSVSGSRSWRSHG